MSTTTNAISSLAAGWRTTCGVFNDQLQCFGWNQYGQIGVGPDGNQFLPVPIEVSAGTSTDLQEFDVLSLGVVHTCATTKQTKDLYCWGSNDSVDLLLKRPVSYFTPQHISLGGQGVFQDSDTQVLQIASGRSHNCAVVSYPYDFQKERFICWGSNEFGQLGIGSTDEFETPVEVGSAIDNLDLLPQQISAGYSHQCAIQAADNSLWCWGLNLNGQIGVGTNTNVLTPTKISQLGAVSTVAAGSYHTCVITMLSEAAFDAREDEDGRKEGNVYCFGYNSFGQLGIGNLEDQQFPQKVDLGGLAKEIKAGRDHTCALMEDETVKCWGSNFSGQLGVGNSRDLSTTPVTVSNLRGVEKLALGREHTCASKSDQTLWCWGTNLHGQLGLGEDIPNQYLPQQVNIQFPLNPNSPPPTESPTEPPSKAPVRAPSNPGPSKIPPPPTPIPTIRPTTRSPTKLPTLSPTKLPTPPPTFSPTRRAITLPTDAPVVLSEPTLSPTKRAIPIPTDAPVAILEPTVNQPTADATVPPTSIKPTPNRLITFPTTAPSAVDKQDDVPTAGQSIIIIVPTTDVTTVELDSGSATIHSARGNLILIAVTFSWCLQTIL
mmetsp:Transcript_5390/g.12721  ORF Transcript_5390/g.12721 Transcript_5390/m.12721 type:complete len:603 (+) Transcript_5390:126-1934(+)